MHQGTSFSHKKNRKKIGEGTLDPNWTSALGLATANDWAPKYLTVGLIAPSQLCNPSAYSTFQFCLENL